MPNWGTGPGSANTVPNWTHELTGNTPGERPYHGQSSDNVHMTDEGWVREANYTDSAGNARVNREVLVSHRSLQSQVNVDDDKLYVVDMRWTMPYFANTTTGPGEFNVLAGSEVTFDVIFNQPVAYASAATWAMVNPGGGDTTATYLSGNGTNKIEFTATTSTSAGNAVNPLGLTLTVMDAWDSINEVSTGQTAGIAYNFAAGAPELISNTSIQEVKTV